MPAQELPHTLRFDQHLPFDPSSDFESFLKLAPARWVVYLMCDGDQRPVQLLCVKNLRNSLKRRFGSDEHIGPSRRVNYRELVRSIHYCRVDSVFEADWIYYELARVVFPESYRGMVGFRPAWFLHVNDQASFPRYIKTTDLTIRTGVLIGPIEDKHSANRLTELVEDAFDLCRYYHILVQAPNGLACAYKEMGKCPAPCDGSISMEQFRRLIEWSAKVLVDPAEYIREQTRRMQQAAKELRFELAAKIKIYVDQLSVFGKGPYRHVGRLSDFQFVSFQRGPKPGTAKIFLISPGQIRQVLCIIGEKFAPADVMRLALEAAAIPADLIDTTGTERVGIAAHHLFSPKNTHGVFLPLATIDERKVTRAFLDLAKQTSTVYIDPNGEDNDEGDEGVMKELTAL